jgi:hypothetical protein
VLISISEQTPKLHRIGVTDPCDAETPIPLLVLPPAEHAIRRSLVVNGYLSRH